MRLLDLPSASIASSRSSSLIRRSHRADLGVLRCKRAYMRRTALHERGVPATLGTLHLRVNGLSGKGATSCFIEAGTGCRFSWIDALVNEALMAAVKKRSGPAFKTVQAFPRRSPLSRTDSTSNAPPVMGECNSGVLSSSVSMKVTSFWVRIRAVFLTSMTKYRISSNHAGVSSRCAP